MTLQGRLNYRDASQGLITLGRSGLRQLVKREREPLLNLAEKRDGLMCYWPRLSWPLLDNE